MKVLIVDDDKDLRDTMADLVRTAWGGAHVPVTFGNVAELTSRPEEALDAGLAIIDINLGRDMPTGLEAERWLRNRGFAGRMVFLTGHAASHPDVERALNEGRLQVLQKPISFEAFCELIEGKKTAA